MQPNLSTLDYARIIAESINNGQHKQAVTQWRAAVKRPIHCNPRALLEDIRDELDSDNATIAFCANILSNIDK